MALASERRLVLLAEDDVMVRNLVRLVLEEANFAVMVAADGVEALAVSRAHPERIDILLTDLDMPRMNGVSLIEQIQQERPEIRVLAISGRLWEPLRIANVEVSVLPKPFSPDVLVQTIRALL